MVSDRYQASVILLENLILILPLVLHDMESMEKQLFIGFQCFIVIIYFLNIFYLNPVILQFNKIFSIILLTEFTAKQHYPAILLFHFIFNSKISIIKSKFTKLSFILQIIYITIRLQLIHYQLTLIFQLIFILFILLLKPKKQIQKYSNCSSSQLKFEYQNHEIPQPDPPSISEPKFQTVKQLQSASQFPDDPLNNNSMFYFIVQKFPEGVGLINFNELKEPNVHFCNQSMKILLKIVDKSQVIKKISSLHNLQQIQQDPSQKDDDMILSFQSYQSFIFESSFKKRNQNRRSFTNNFTQSSNRFSLSQNVKKESFDIGNEFGKALYKASLDLLRNLQDNKTQQQFYCTFNGYIESEMKQERCLEIKIYLTYFEGQPFIFLLVRDVTHRDVIKCLYNQGKAKQNSLNYVSHEYRTPLNCIITLLENSEEELQNDKEKYSNLLKNLRITLQNCYYLLNLSNDLLDLAQMKVGKFKLIKKEFNLYQLLQQIIEIFQINAMKRQLELKLEYDEDALRVINNDENRIKQVVTNLIGNAFKFTLKGQIVISVKKKQEELEVRIKDSGIGIKEEDQGNLMKAFGKSENDESKELNRQGVGLGLLISNIIAQSLNKQGNGLQVESVYGEGSSFYFNITSGEEKKQFNEIMIRKVQSIKPQQGQNSIILEEQVDELQSQSQQYSVPSSLDRIQRLPNQIIRNGLKRKQCNCIHILIIDDVYFNILALQLILKKYGVSQTDSAISGELGLEMIQEKQKSSCCKEYRLIFLDLEMPGMNGYQTYGKILEKKIMSRVVACSGHSSDKEKEKSFQMGIVDYLEKPLKKEEVSNIIQKYYN